MRGIVIAWAAALATVSCNPSSSPTPEALQAIRSKALKVLVEQINGKNLKYFAPLLLRIRGTPLMMMSAATIGATSSRWIQSREQKDLRYAIKILMAFTIQREAEHIARLGTLESTSRQLVVYGPNATAQWSRFERLEEALKDVNETVGAIKTKLNDAVQEMANQSGAVAKQHTAQMEAAAQHHTEQMAAAAQHHTEQMAAAEQHHQEQKAAAAQQMACLLAVVVVAIVAIGYRARAVATERHTEITGLLAGIQRDVSPILRKKRHHVCLKDRTPPPSPDTENVPPNPPAGAPGAPAGPTAGRPAAAGAAGAARARPFVQRAAAAVGSLRAAVSGRPLRA